MSHALQPLAAYLPTNACFAQLSSDQQAALLTAVSFCTFETDEIVFLEGEPALGLWWIERGSVKIYKATHHGQEQILHIAGPRETFNDVAVYDHGSNPANVAALSPTKLWLIPSHTIQELMAVNNGFNQAIIFHLAKRIRAFTNQIELLTLHNVTSRLACFLLAQDQLLAQQGLTRKALASYLAMTPESISRSLRNLQEQGAIQFDRQQITICDVALLQKMAHGR